MSWKERREMRSLNCLVVESRVTDLMSFLRCISEENMIITVVDNVLAAAEFLEHGYTPDIILLEWPPKDGQKAVYKAFLKATKMRGIDSPAVLLTTRKTPNQTAASILIEDEAFEWGALGVLFKPYTRESVTMELKAIGRIMSNKKKAAQQDCRAVQVNLIGEALYAKLGMGGSCDG